MSNWSVALKCALALPLAAVGSVFGAGGYLVLFFCAAALIDWLTGTMKAMKSGNWTSSTAREGLWHKTGEFISLLVAGGIDLMLYYISVSVPSMDFSYKSCLLPVVCVWYICTELGSILENVGQLGAPIPKFLCRMIEVLRAQVDTATEEDAGEVKIEK